jgi:cytidylate kinase
LRAKESDRIRAVVENLRAIGVDAVEHDDGFDVLGTDAPLCGRVTTYGDHRLAMAFGVLGALPGNDIVVDDRACVAVSYPMFWDDLARVTSHRLSPDDVRGAAPSSASREGSVTSRLVIAIDGPAASGKSSTAQWVAERLGVRHVDSGAFYRAMTWLGLASGVSPDAWTEDALLRDVGRVGQWLAAFSVLPMIDGVEHDAALRENRVTQHVSRVAQMPRVREWVNDQVRLAARATDVVVDGRDIGTAVFPDAAVKVFLIADPWERARRRLVQRLSRRPSDVEIAAETESLVSRDAQDATQSAPARDAIIIDTTALTQAEQVDRIVALARAARRDH